MGIRASRRPFAAYTHKPGEVLGNHWYIPNVRRTAQFAHVLIDTNYWKSFVHSGLESRYTSGLRLPSLPANLYASGMGWQAHPQAGACPPTCPA